MELKLQEEYQNGRYIGKYTRQVFLSFPLELI